MHDFETLEDALKYFIELRNEYRVKYASLKKVVPNPHSHLLVLHAEITKIGKLLERNGIDINNV